MPGPPKEVVSATAAVLAAALSASCGVFSSAADCAQRADCLDLSVNGDESDGPAAPDGAARPSDGASPAPGATASGAPGARGMAAATDSGADALVTSEPVDATAPPVRDGAGGPGLDATDGGIEDEASASDAAQEAPPPDTGPACTLECVPPTPAGWSGPVALWEGSSGSTAPSCPSGFSKVLDAMAGLDARAASCSCACSASGQVCDASGTVYSDQACTTTCASASPNPSGACTDLASGTCGADGSFMLSGTPTPSGGKCSAQVTPVVPAATWTTSARLCAFPTPVESAAGCPAGDVCLPPPPAPFGSTSCVYSSADPPPSACPAGYDAAAPVVFWSGFVDDRGCGSCTCSGPTGGTCSGSVTLYGGTGCDTAAGYATYPVGSSCSTYAGLMPAPGSVSAHLVASGGSCSVQTQPAPTGSATPTGSVTVCCTP